MPKNVNVYKNVVQNRQKKEENYGQRRKNADSHQKNKDISGVTSK